MKVIIDIDERAYKGCLKLKSNDDMGVLGFHLINATANGTLLSDNATNGDVIKTLFPNIEIKESHKDMYGTPHIYKVYKLDIYPTYFTSDFWNAPYKEKQNETDN